MRLLEPPYRPEGGPLTQLAAEYGAALVLMCFDSLACEVKLHDHPFPHDLHCDIGSAIVIIDGTQTIIRAGDPPYLVAAGKRHSIYPLEAPTHMRCRHADPRIKLEDATLEGWPHDWFNSLRSRQETTP